MGSQSEKPRQVRFCGVELACQSNKLNCSRRAWGIMTGWGLGEDEESFFTESRGHLKHYESPRCWKCQRMVLKCVKCVVSSMGRDWLRESRGSCRKPSENPVLCQDGGFSQIRSVSEAHCREAVGACGTVGRRDRSYCHHYLSYCCCLFKKSLVLEVFRESYLSISYCQ